MDSDSEIPTGHEIDWDQLIRQLSNPETAAQAAGACRRYILGTLLAKHGTVAIPALAKRMDPTDIADSVMKSFWRVSSNYADVQGDEVRKILLTIIRNKTTDKLRENFAAKRDVRRESTAEDYLLETGKPTIGESSSRVEKKVGEKKLKPKINVTDFQTLVDQFLTPECFELFNDFNNRLPKQLHEVFLLTVQGFSNAEIAEHLKCSERTIKRKQALIRDELGDWQT